MKRPMLSVRTRLMFISKQVGDACLQILELRSEVYNVHKHAACLIPSHTQAA